MAPTLAVASDDVLPALNRHPHAKAVLGAALPPQGQASHAYLFHGPAGAGKRQAALEFAAALLSDGSADPAGAHERVLHKVHPDLTWVAPMGAAEMLVSDIDDAVVGAVSHTPFESRRRVFVLERVDTMSDKVANKMLKTLEEPPPFAHLLLLTDRPANVLPTIASRCQPVRFEAASEEDVVARLGRHGVPELQARTCARLALGDADAALALALGEGPALRAAAETFARACVSGDLRGAPWSGLLTRARADGERAEAAVVERVAAEAEYLPDREARRARREGDQEARRIGRRSRTAALDRGMLLAGLWLRDVACVLDGAAELVHHLDRGDQVREDAERVAEAVRARRAVELVEEARTTAVLNPTEELLLEALASRVERVLNP